MRNIKEGWEQVQSNLQNTISALFFQLWIQNLEAIEIKNRVLYILAPTKVCKDRCVNKESEFYNDLCLAINSVFDTQIDKFEIVTQEEYEKIKVDTPKQKESTVEIKHENNFNPKYTFENYIVGKSNQFVYAAALAVAENPGKKFNPLFVYGGVGLGKTHLLHAIGLKLNREKPELNVLYCTCDKFIREYIDSLKSGINSFRDKYRNVDVLMIDDIHNLVGKKETQEEFFNTFKDLFEANKQIILTSDRSPDNIETLEDRLRSRFKGGLVQDVKIPDFETKYAILQKKAEQDNYNVESEVITYIAERMDTNIRELEGMLQKVSFMANLKGKHFADIEDVKAALQETAPVDKEVITAEKIIDVVCEYSNIAKADIIGKKKTKEIADTRQVAIYLICDMLDLPLVNIGKIFGGRDHTTIIHSRDKISDQLKVNTRLNQMIKDLKDRLK
ncbi:MAG: chromosomal replication initiator protein DnaA [Clostridia bacterium]|nr:chromosomal replication initiator protein DnaA [Clostridia bacterium]